MDKFGPEYRRKWYKDHPGKIKEYRAKWKQQNPGKMREYYIKRQLETPWCTVLYGIRARCNNPKSKDYPLYGARGIKAAITKLELKSLWFRDQAVNLARPSIDRIDRLGNYTYANCRFIELSMNTTLANKARARH